jgi:hypothetical protein
MKQWVGLCVLACVSSAFARDALKEPSWETPALRTLRVGVGASDRWP